VTRRAAVAAAILAGVAAADWSRPAAAYRPFDGTDAAVAEAGDAEVELGPAQYQRDGAARTLTAPALVLNYGFAPGWEAVLEGRAQHGFSGGVPHHSLVDNAFQLKHVLRDGSLQEKSGPSVATEFGLLLPGLGEDSGLGGTAGLVASERWPFARLHLNAFAAATRDHHADLFLSAIVEGPPDWPVRPVAELAHERDFGQTRSFAALVGAIWQVSESVALDVGLRGGRVNEHTVNELRAGLTFSFAVR
jgi:hypothetical protein